MFKMAGILSGAFFVCITSWWFNNYDVCECTIVALKAPLTWMVRRHHQNTCPGTGLVKWL